MLKNKRDEKTYANINPNLWESRGLSESAFFSALHAQNHCCCDCGVSVVAKDGPCPHILQTPITPAEQEILGTKLRLRFRIVCCDCYQKEFPEQRRAMAAAGYEFVSVIN
jgi:hypothetical protein